MHIASSSLTCFSEWCGNSTFEDSYAGIESDFASYNVAAYFSEFGCITAGTPRPWTEVGAILSSQMSPVWSGGIAFSYFPASSAAGQFGMVTISSDGKTVTTSQDFDNLKTQYAAASPPNSPSQSAAGSTTYPSCPAQSSNLLASTQLPPTPNLSACTCLEKNIGCVFTPLTSNYTAIVGSLLDYGCSLLGQAGGSCNDLSANGTTGQYGLVSECDPSTYDRCILVLSLTRVLYSCQVVIRYERVLWCYKQQRSVLQLWWEWNSQCQGIGCSYLSRGLVLVYGYWHLRTLAS